MPNPLTYEQNYDRLRALTEASLERYFCPEMNIVQPLRDAMAYSVLGGGKRVRAVLVLAGCEMAGKSARDALPLACALEMIHAYSLIHDDLPCMDDDDLRRGKPSNHIVYGEALAVLAGDGLLSYAAELLWNFACKMGGMEACREIMHAAGIFGMVAGQTLDVHLEGQGGGDSEQLQFIHRNKTAAMIRGGVLAGLRMGGASPTQLAAGKVYGENLGLAFQATDDLLDIEGDAATLGKPVGSDAKKGKLTLPALVGVERTRTLAQQYIQTAVDALAPFGEQGWFYAQLAQRMAARKA